LSPRPNLPVIDWVSARGNKSAQLGILVLSRGTIGLAIVVIQSVVMSSGSGDTIVVNGVSVVVGIVDGGHDGLLVMRWESGRKTFVQCDGFTFTTYKAAFST
jgi:hypothetical protein